MTFEELRDALEAETCAFELDSSFEGEFSLTSQGEHPVRITLSDDGAWAAAYAEDFKL